MASAVRCVAAAAILAATAPGAALAGDAEYAASILLPSATVQVRSFDLEAPTLAVDVRNTGRRPWLAADRMYVSYHVLDAAGGIVQWDNPRSAPLVLRSGESARVQMRLPETLAASAATATLQLDVVREGVAWLSQSTAARFPVAQVAFVAESPSALRGRPEFRRAESLATGDSTVDDATLLATFALLKARREMTVAGRRLQVLTAGADYPQAWIRDCATAVRAAYLVLGAGAARGCVEAHLIGQHDDGSVDDWIDATGRSDKNSVESDQESSLVIAAAEYVHASGDRGFLERRVAAVPVLRRLERALAHVWERRRDATTGLVVGGHTIDWGDVQIGAATQAEAVHLAPGSPLTVAIYDNAMYVGAIRAYLSLLPARGEWRASRGVWAARLAAMREATRRLLWDDARGHFVMHRHVTPMRHDFDEDAMFAMGGNAVAIEAGLADATMSRSIVARALREQRAHSAATLCGVLYPPYPEGTYAFAAVSRPWQYQNGGAWDWLGLRLIRAMHRQGDRDEAGVALRQIAAKVLRNGTFSEWDDLDGTARGSRDYAGAAGQYLAAVAEMRPTLRRR